MTDKEILINWIKENPASFEDSNDSYHDRRQVLMFAKYYSEIKNKIIKEFAKEMNSNSQKIFETKDIEMKMLKTSLHAANKHALKQSDKIQLLNYKLELCAKQSGV